MPDQFEVKKACGPISESEFYRFIGAYYLHQDTLSWSRTQNLFAVEAGVLVAAFTRHGWLALLALLLGSGLVFLIWRLIQRDWQIRDQYNPYFDEFHKAWGVTLGVPPKNRWYRGHHIVKIIYCSMIALNLCFAFCFALELAGCFKFGLN